MIDYAIVLFASHYLQLVEEGMRALEDTTTPSYQLVKIAEVPGWMPRMSVTLYKVCKSIEVWAITTKPFAVSEENEVNVLEVCANANSVFFIASGSAHLESIVAKHLMAKK